MRKKFFCNANVAYLEGLLLLTLVLELMYIYMYALCIRAAKSLTSMDNALMRRYSRAFVARQFVHKSQVLNQFSYGLYFTFVRRCFRNV